MDYDSYEDFDGAVLHHRVMRLQLAIDGQIRKARRACRLGRLGVAFCLGIGALSGSPKSPGRMLMYAGLGLVAAAILWELTSIGVWNIRARKRALAAQKLAILRELERRHEH